MIKRTAQWSNRPIHNEKKKTDRRLDWTNQLMDTFISVIEKGIFNEVIYQGNSPRMGLESQKRFMVSAFLCFAL